MILLPAELTEEQIQAALSNVQHAVVGILERWSDSIRVMNHWFPWIDFSSDPNKRRMFLFSGKETWRDLRPDLLQVLLELNQCDMRLYERMLEKFEDQLDVLNAPYYLR